MHKEVIIAIILGSLLGIVLAFGIWRVNKSFKNSSIESGESVENNTQNDGDTKHKLTLISPSDKSVAVDSYTTVKGLTNPNSYVTISSEDDDLVLLSNEEGSFEQEVELVGGINDLVISSIDDQNVLSENVMIVYSNELENNDEENKVTDEVEKRLEEASKKYIAQMGTITDITENSIQIKNDDSEILQLSIDDSTTYANIVKTAKEVNFEDVAIGDYIIALGSLDGNEILVSKRILITSNYTGTTRKTLIGTVTEFNTKNFLIDTKDGEISLDATGSVITTYVKDGEIAKGRLSLAEEGDQIIVMGEPNGEDFEVSRVHILPLEE